MSHPIALDGPFATALDVREQLGRLEAERSLAVLTGVADIDIYMADLEEELGYYRALYTATAVTEIATLIGELSGPQVG
jgi:hypothetical protein